MTPRLLRRCGCPSKSLLLTVLCIVGQVAAAQRFVPIGKHLDSTPEPISQEAAQATHSRQRAFGVATASFSVKTVAGKHVKYSGYIKTDGVSDGYAGLWWRVDGDNGGKPLAFDNMHDRGATGTTPWTRYEISLDVPANATKVLFGAQHTGMGTAWFDSLQVKVDGVVYKDVSQFDFDFEARTPLGFRTAGNGLQVGLDRRAAYTGRQSLSMGPSKMVLPSTQRQETFSNPKSGTNSLALNSTSEIVDRLLKRMDVGYGLTDEQKRQLRPILVDEVQQIRSSRQDTTLTAAQMTARIRALRTVTKERMDALLTPGQRAQANADATNQLGSGRRRPIVVRSVVKPTADQLAKIRVVLSTEHAQLSALTHDQSLTLEEQRTKRNEIQKAVRQQILAILGSNAAQEMPTDRSSEAR